MSAGDSVTYGGKTYTATDKIALSDANFAAADTFKVGEVEITIAAGSADFALNTTDPTKATIGLDKVSDYINAALADGKQVTATSFKPSVSDAGAAPAAGTAITTGVQIVSKLEDGEVSLAKTKGGKALELVRSEERR